MTFKVLANPPYNKNMFMDIILKIEDSSKEFISTLNSVYLVPVKWDNPIIKYKSNSSAYGNFLKFISDSKYTTEKCFIGAGGGNLMAFLNKMSALFNSIQKKQNLKRLKVSI